ncbi:class I SAM-dependent methyltransferase [Methyloligella solikamskensis]|uniref:Class I SAM-dependent methyltransferase n=1 Tax=Methyloligella solikamskensis TaxID=1177756 RepID=A0ABW3J771_9HYPH
MAAGTAVIDALVKRVGDVSTPFEITLPDGEKRVIGQGAPEFFVTLKNEKAVRAVRSLDEANIAEAYIHGDIDLEGDMLKPFSMRHDFDDQHPLVAAWRFVEPMIFGQVYTNKQAISSHYNADPKLFLSFLDPTFPAYSQGIYESDDEPLSKALERKFDWAIEKCELGKGTRVLEIGPGWGAFAGHALQAGVHFTGITNSEVSRDFLRGKLANFGDDFDIQLVDFLEYEPEEKFDAIVIMGVIEHLPDYERVLRKFADLLKPGGRVFLDGSAAWKKFELSTFMVRHIYPGNHSFLVLDDFINKLAKTPLLLDECHSDRWSYFLTFQQWAKNLDAHKEYIQESFGDFEFRKFRLYLWGAANEFFTRNLDCFRLILHKPEHATWGP